MLSQHMRNAMNSSISTKLTYHSSHPVLQHHDSSDTTALNLERNLTVLTISGGLIPPSYNKGTWYAVNCTHTTLETSLISDP
jgi:hypothetical protein